MQGMGISLASGMRNMTTTSSVTEWTMPDTGVRPPFLMLAAVRAMAPVAGMPPKAAEPILATPCATSSMLGRWWEPIMPSATTADSSDSTPASTAMVTALDSWARMAAKEKSDRCSVSAGKPARISVKDLPMVFTSRCSSSTAAAVTTTAMREPGIFLKNRGQTMRMTRATTPMRTAWRLTVPILAMMAATFSAVSMGFSPC